MSGNPFGLVLSTNGITYSKTGRKPLIYLACPYTSPLPITRMVRNACASEAAALLMEHGYAVFSPISHGHAIMEYTSCLGMDAATWASVNDPILSLCDAVAVLGVEGMWQSAGVRAEVALAAAQGIPINLIKVEDGHFFSLHDADPSLWEKAAYGE